MRIILLFIILISSISITAQTTSPANFANAEQNRMFGDTSRSIQPKLNKKWFFSSYSGIGVGFNFFSGASATVLSAPSRFQLNRRLNNNFYAFTGISVAPAYINFNRSFLSPGLNKMYPGSSLKPNTFGLYSRVDLGLMYVNDARTFSISGSVGVERSTNPIFLYQPGSTTTTSGFIPRNR